MKGNTQRGIIGLIVLIIIALILAKYFFNFSVFDAASSSQGGATISYTHQVLNTVWSYIATPVSLIWNKVVWPILSLAWQSFQALLVWGQNNATSLSGSH